MIAVDPNKYKLPYGRSVSALRRNDYDSILKKMGNKHLEPYQSPYQSLLRGGGKFYSKNQF